MEDVVRRGRRARMAPLDRLVCREHRACVAFRVHRVFVGTLVLLAAVGAMGSVVPVVPSAVVVVVVLVVYVADEVLSVRVVEVAVVRPVFLVVVAVVAPVVRVVHAVQGVVAAVVHVAPVARVAHVARLGGPLSAAPQARRGRLSYVVRSPTRRVAATLAARGCSSSWLALWCGPSPPTAVAGTPPAFRRVATLCA